MSGRLPPLSLYLHFPWCVAKCPYCDFNSYSLRGALPAQQYTDALIRELKALPAELAERPLVAVFMGGGTPSLFPPAELARIMATVRERLCLPPGTEVTLEANPGALEHAAFAEYLEAGINRLSLGVQSFSDRQLDALGRVHNAAAARSAFREARAAGFANINIDLMYALPEQTLQQAEYDVTAAVELGPEHISYYHLTLEPNTVFHARPPRLPDADESWEIQAASSGALRAAGYRNYEVSAWSQPGRECVHNLNYWNFGDYIGLGAGAHGKLTRPSGMIYREVRAAHPRDYLRQSEADLFPGIVRQVATADVAFEFMLNALRLRDGVSLLQFEHYTGLSRVHLEPSLSRAQDLGLLAESDSGWLRPTPRGWRFLDDLQALFLPAQD